LTKYEWNRTGLIAEASNDNVEVDLKWHKHKASRECRSFDFRHFINFACWWKGSLSNKGIWTFQRTER